MNRFLNFNLYLVAALLLLGLHPEHQAASRFLPLSAPLNLPPASQQKIPEPDRPLTPEESKWWEGLRAAGDAFARATKRKNKVVFEELNEHLRRGSHPEDEEDILTPGLFKKLNDEVSAARERYVALLQEGATKSFTIPVRDGAPLLLQWVTPIFSTKGREKRISGEVRLRLEILPDGRFGEVEVRDGLGYGLDEKAIEAARKTVFLPARKDGRFVSYWQVFTVEFNIK
jgi:TonB family protein